MPNRSRRQAGSARLMGRARAAYLARRLGIGLRESRIALGITQKAAGQRAGVSQGFWSALERGLGPAASLETLAACAAAVEAQLAAFLEARPGADLPRDIAHLRGQALIIRVAANGGWLANVERSIDPAAQRSRAIDVELRRPERGEAVVVELVDLLADGGSDMRGLSDKVGAVRRELPGARVAGLLVVRGTRRNRAMIGELAAVIEARFPGSSARWLRALRDRDTPLPEGDGFLWVRVDASGLFARRRTS